MRDDEWTMQGFSAGVCDSPAVARRVQAESTTLSLKDDIIRIASAFDTVEEDANFFGYDGYVDGFGSPLRMGMFSVTTAFCDYEGTAERIRPVFQSGRPARLRGSLLLTL